MRHLTRSRIPRKAESTNYSIQVGEGILLRSALLYPFLLCENCGAFFISGLDFCLQDSDQREKARPTSCLFPLAGGWDLLGRNEFALRRGFGHGPNPSGRRPRRRRPVGRGWGYLAGETDEHGGTTWVVLFFYFTHQASQYIPCKRHGGLPCLFLSSRYSLGAIRLLT